MTANVQQVLNKICNNEIFNDELYFVGGTAQFSKVDSKITSTNDIINFIALKKEPKDDEAVYLSESDRMDLNFEQIKEQVIEKIH